MLDHCTYDKIKLIHELSSVLWFIKQHSIENAKTAGDKECQEAMKKLAEDLESHIDTLATCLKKAL